MALVLADRVYETSTTVGTGTLTLAGALNSYQTFSAAIGNGNTCYYALAAVGGTDWEVGIGTVGAGTLARTTILSSSNSNLVVNLPIGTVNVFVTYPSERSVNLDASGNATALGTPVAFAGTNITGTAASLTAGTVTDGVYTTGSYSNPAWITALANSKITGLGSAALLTAGAAGGVATLDGGGTVPTSQLPAAVLGAIKYQGTWNATTNVPALTSSVGTQGYYYVVATAGTTDLNGIASWAVGDWAIFGTATWQKIDNTDAVTSVNGFTGTVSLAYADLAGAIPTWNQNTSGNAATVTTNANLTGDVTSVGNATTVIKINGTTLSTLGTGILKNTTGTGVPSIAIAADFPTLNQNTSGSAGSVAYSGLTGTAPTWNQDTTGTAAKTNALNSATTVVNVSSSAAPTNGQILTATGGTAATWQTPSGGGATLSNDTTTATQLYPMFAAATSGVPTNVYTSDAKLLYKPSTGELAVTAPIAANGLLIHATTVTSSYTVAAGFNSLSVGPITVGGGAVVTIAAGQRWLVL